MVLTWKNMKLVRAIFLCIPEGVAEKVFGHQIQLCWVLCQRHSLLKPLKHWWLLHYFMLRHSFFMVLSNNADAFTVDVICGETLHCTWHLRCTAGCRLQACKKIVCTMTHFKKFVYVNMWSVTQNVVETLKLVLSSSCDGVSSKWVKEN